jgi:hypothetical protein
LRALAGDRDYPAAKLKLDPELGASECQYNKQYQTVINA